MAIDIDKIWKESGRNNEKALELVKAAGGTRDDFQKWKDNKKENFSWQKNHQPNFTGTSKLNNPAKTTKIKEKYQAWKP